MSSISSIDTSIYSGIIEHVSTFSNKDALRQPVEQVSDETPSDYREVDLSNYYSNIRPEDLLSQTGENVVKSAQDLDNAMVSALQNGYTVNDVCNIKLAEAAYKANCFVFKSTFELMV